MAQIRTKNGSMAVTFGHDFHQKAEMPGFTGVCSQISWNNASVMEGLRKMFNCADNEIITAIEVDNYGIKAQFERI